MPPLHRLTAELTLLLVEDDRAALEILEFIVSSRLPRSTVHLAYDGAMGLEQFKRHLPDLVITDINMPKMDGIQLTREIKRVNKDAKVIVMTAYSDRVHLDQFREIGVSTHLMKPLEFDKMIDAILEVGEELERAEKERGANA